MDALHQHAITHGADCRQRIRGCLQLADEAALGRAAAGIRTRRCGELEPAASLRDKFSVVGGWLPSLTFALGAMDTPQRSGASRFWKIYGIVMAVDLLVYFLIFYAGRAIPPASPYTSFPGNYGLCLGWIFAHFPAALIYWDRPFLPDSLLWLLAVQDAWLASVIVLWLRRKRR